MTAWEALQSTWTEGEGALPDVRARAAQEIRRHRRSTVTVAVLLAAAALSAIPAFDAPEDVVHLIGWAILGFCAAMGIGFVVIQRGIGSPEMNGPQAGRRVPRAAARGRAPRRPAVPVGVPRAVPRRCHPHPAALRRARIPDAGPDPDPGLLRLWFRDHLHRTDLVRTDRPPAAVRDRALARMARRAEPLTRGRAGRARSVARASPAAGPGISIWVTEGPRIPSPRDARCGLLPGHGGPQR